VQKNRLFEKGGTTEHRRTAKQSKARVEVKKKKRTRKENGHNGKKA